MESYAFMDDLLNKSVLANREIEQKRGNDVFLAELDTEGEVTEVLITKDPKDVKSKYSGIGYTTSPYLACDRCGFARGYRPGAYKATVKGRMTVKIACHTCADHHKRKGSERPSYRFGRNKEAKHFQKLFGYKKNIDSTTMEVDVEIGSTAAGADQPK